MTQRQPETPDWRLYVISELDQILAELDAGSTEAYDQARDWLSDLIMDGDRDVIATMLCGWQREMVASLDREREEGNDGEAEAAENH